MRTIKRRIYTKLTGSERDLLAIWKAEDVSNKQCAKRLNRSVSTIGRELKRNSCYETQEPYYVAIHAHAKAVQHQQRSAQGKQELKNREVYDYVTGRLRDGWSPDQIAGRLKRNHPADTYWWITAETIYRWVYQPKQVKTNRPWYEYLRRKQKKRKKQTGRTVHRVHIPDRISIHERPEEVNQRKEFGHWEGDTIEGKGRKSGVHTEVERISRKIQGATIGTITSEETIQVQRTLFESLPKEARRSTTLDNGKENHMHYKLKDIRMNTYFADPYSSWQRGTNEHGNWHIRYYFPKGTDFSTVPAEELQDVIEEINNRPRKILNYQTANEKFQELLEKEGRVAINP